MTPCPANCTDGILDGDQCGACEGHGDIDARDAARARREAREARERARWRKDEGPRANPEPSRDGLVATRLGPSSPPGEDLTRSPDGNYEATRPKTHADSTPSAPSPQPPRTFAEQVRAARSVPGVLPPHPLDLAIPPAEDTAELAPPAKRSKRAAEHTDDGAPDWEGIRAEAAGYAPGPFGWVLYQEEQLARSGENFPALSPFSLYTIERFFISGKRWLLWMAGRGFGKSTLTSRLATAIGFGVERRAAPGPAWVCPLVSVLPVDAERRLDDIKQILFHAYRQEVKPTKATIAATDANRNAIAWVSSASTIGNVSGPSSFAALVDEEEKILYGRAGSIVGSLAFTFRSRPRVYGMRVSSAMSVDDTLARACAKGNGPGSPLTNFVATLGPFVGDAVTGLLAVAQWEAARGNGVAADAIRAHAATLTPDSWQIPTWLGHPSIGKPDDMAARLWTPGDAAIATRIEADVVDGKDLDGLPPWRYWLRECASMPTGDGGPGEAWRGLVDRNAQLRERVQGRSPVATLGQHPNAQPGDPRYAGPVRRGPGGGPML